MSCPFDHGKGDSPIEPVNIVDVALFADGPPHPLFARMRADEPVRWNVMADGRGFWSVTKHEHVAAVSRDHETFSSHRGGLFLHPDQIMPLDFARNMMMYKDPPEHTKFRKILQSAFTPTTVRELEGPIRRHVTETIDEFIERGECDFAKDFAIPVPLKVLTDLLGVPKEDISKLHHWTDQIEEASRAPVPMAGLVTFAEMAQYIMGQILRQLAEGGDTLVMRLHKAEVDGESLDESEILGMFGMLMFAGNDTVRSTVAVGVHALLEHRDQWKRLVDDPSRIPVAVEEVLRWTSVVNYFVRTANRDTELGGQAIKEGDMVVIWYTSASRDEAACADPQRFDVTRTEQDHMAFGGGGRHFCLGAGLARLELRVILEELTRRLPDLTLAGPVVRLNSSWVNGITSLPVKFTPAAREA